MLFILGYLTGLVTCVLVFAILSALNSTRIVASAAGTFRKAAKKLDKKVGGVLPIQKGFIHVPPDDDELARQEIIEENSANGRDTPISQLRT